MADDTAEPERTPAQLATLERLGARPDDRPTFASDLRDRLRADLEGQLQGPLTVVPDGTRVFVKKHDLATVHQCEARWQADDLDETFEPSVPVIAGVVAHKAIELTLNRRSPSTPPELVDAALDRLTDSDRWAGEWLARCDEDDRAEVRSAAVARVSSFGDVFPPLKAAWHPVTEQSLRAELAGDRVVLQGKVDLVVGRTEGTRAGKVIVDFKTGNRVAHHADDLRFYALIETLRTGVPPRALATAYLDSGRLQVESVTEAVLDAAVARTADGVERIVAIRHAGDEAARRPSAVCSWCRALDACAEGQAHLEDQDP